MDKRSSHALCLPSVAINCQVYVEKTGFPSFPLLSKGFLFFNSRSEEGSDSLLRVFFLSFLYALEHKAKVAAEIFGTKAGHAEPIV